MRLLNFLFIASKKIQLNQVPLNLEGNCLVPKEQSYDEPHNYKQWFKATLDAIAKQSEKNFFLVCDSIVDE